MGKLNKQQNNKYKNSPGPGGSVSLKNYEDFDKLAPSRFYTEKEEVTLRFYQTPKALFNNPAYKGLALGPKLMYSILRDRLDISIKNNWKDEKGYIYLIFSVEELANLLEIDRTAVMRYKKKLVEYKLIIDKRLGQGNPNRIYVLKPELVDNNSLKSQNATSRSGNIKPLEVSNSDSIDTYVNKTEKINNVNNAISNKRKKRTPEMESFAQEIAERLEDDHSLGFYRKVVDTMPKNLIWQALSEVKDTALTGKIKKSKAALFTSVIKAKAIEYNISFDIK
jgi:predicted transcriptional regulator